MMPYLRKCTVVEQIENHYTLPSYSTSGPYLVIFTLLPIPVKDLYTNRLFLG